MQDLARLSTFSLKNFANASDLSSFITGIWFKCICSGIIMNSLSDAILTDSQSVLEFPGFIFLLTCCFRSSKMEFLICLLRMLADIRSDTLP